MKRPVRYLAAVVLCIIGLTAWAGAAERKILVRVPGIT